MISSLITKVETICLKLEQKNSLLVLPVQIVHCSVIFANSLDTLERSAFAYMVTLSGIDCMGNHNLNHSFIIILVSTKLLRLKLLLTKPTQIQLVLELQRCLLMLVLMVVSQKHNVNKLQT